MRPIALMLALALAPAGLARADDSSACLAQYTAHQPKSVVDFMVRRNRCALFGGDEPVSHKMAVSPSTPKAIRELRCDQILPDETALRHRYARTRAVLEALDKADSTIC